MPTDVELSALEGPRVYTPYFLGWRGGARGGVWRLINVQRFICGESGPFVWRKPTFPADESFIGCVVSWWCTGPISFPGVSPAFPLPLITGITSTVKNDAKITMNCTTMYPLFEYLPLQTGYQEIRLAVLLTGKKDDEIVCKIHHCPLESCPSYVALSYVWGDSEQTRPLFLTRHGDDKNLKKQVLRITSNLEDALRSFRDGADSIAVWIDAICINQADLAERSSQVAMMREIYSKAEKTVVYFGPESEFSSVGMAMIVRLCGAIDPSILPEVEMARFRDSMKPDEHPLRKVLADLNALDAAAEFFTRPWWSRLWIVQELSVAKKAVFIWGKDAFDWEACARTVVVFNNYIGHLQHSPEFEQDAWQRINGGHERAWAVAALYQRFKKGDRRPLLGLLQDFWINEATDPRDKVYALLGLATDSHTESIVPHYSLSVGSVYGSSVRDLMLRCGNLDVLSLCSGVGARRVEGLATWAPDWTSAGKKSKRVPGYHTFPLFVVEQQIRRNYRSAKASGESLFCASGHTNSFSTVRFSEDFRELYLTGIVVDTIRDLSDVRSYLFRPAEILDIWGPMGDRLGSDYPTGESVPSAFHQTLCFDQFWPYPAISHPAEIVMFQATATSGQRFMLTCSGLMGLAMLEAEKGDLICVLKGLRTRVILREEADHFLMVGETYGKCPRA
jgi:hypothetical protein